MEAFCVVALVTKCRFNRHFVIYPWSCSGLIDTVRLLLDLGTTVFKQSQGHSFWSPEPIHRPLTGRSRSVLINRQWAHNIAEHAAVDRFPCKDAITHEQMYLALPAVDLTKQLADHAREESLFARQQVLVHTKALGRVSSTPYLKEQGVLF